MSKLEDMEEQALKELLKEEYFSKESRAIMVTSFFVTVWLRTNHPMLLAMILSDTYDTIHEIIQKRERGTN